MSSVKSKLLGRFASLESDVPPESDDTPVDSPIEGEDETGAQIDGENIVEGDLVDAADDQEEIREADDEVGQLEETAESLESFLTAAAIGTKTGGWSPDVAMAYALGIENAVRPIGLTIKDVTPSLESYEATTERERVEQTAAIENAISQALRDIWEAIKRAINKVVTFVRKWYVKIMDGASRLKKRAIAIRKKADDTTGSAENSKITTSSFAVLNVNRAMPTADNLIGSINEVREIVKKLTKGQLEKSYETVLNDLVNTVTEVTAKEGGVEAAAAATAVGNLLKSSLFKMDLGLSKTGDAEKLASISGTIGLYTNTATVKTTDRLPGNKEFAVVEIGGIKGPGESTSEYARALASAFKVAGKVALIDADKKKLEIDTSKEVAVLKQSEASQICTAVIELCDVIVDYKLGFENYGKKTAAAIGKVDNAVRKLKADDKDAAERQRGEFARALAQAIGSIVRNHSLSVNAVIGYGVNLGRSSLVYVVQSLAEYK